MKFNLQIDYYSPQSNSQDGLIENDVFYSQKNIPRTMDYGGNLNYKKNNREFGTG